MKVLIVYNIPANENSADDLDVLTQVEAVKKSLIELSHNVVEIGVDLNLELFQQKVKEISPDIVFNLIEALNGTEAFMHFIPIMLENLMIPFTGGNSESLYITTNKVLTKKMFDQNNILTPKWFTTKNNIKKNNFPVPCIIKPIRVDASVGINDSSIIYDLKKLDDEFKIKIEKHGECFVEEFIDGREFNISVFKTANGPMILPIAEIKFENYPADKAKIVNYDAKWNEKSFEYNHTVRHFDFTNEDEELLENFKNITLKCWEIFELNGYARVDFRVDNENNIFALELNVNPCISPDSGFFASCEKYGWNYTTMVEIILNAVEKY